MSFKLAQVNVAYMLADEEDPLMADFVAQLDEINALADRSPGFVWRYISDTREATEREFEDGKVLFNMSVWDDIASLHNYTYRTDHAKVFAKRAKWFHDWQDRARQIRELGENAPSMCLWWVPEGHLPTAAEAIEKLRHAGRHGLGPEVFSFKQPYSIDGKPLKPVKREGVFEYVYA